MKSLMAVFAVMAPSAAMAQSQGGQIYSNAFGGFTSGFEAPRNVDTFNPNYVPFAKAGLTQCPPSGEAREERQSRALALRTEAANLVRRDGGTLSRWSLERIRRKASAILAYGC